MKKLCYLGLLLFAACSSTTDASSGSNAQAAAPARDPACGNCATSCCQDGTTVEAPACCDEAKAGAAKKN